MNSLKKALRDWLIGLKSKKLLKSRRQTFQLPAAALSIHKVLVILPRQLNEIESATNFVYRLKKTYPSWKIDIFDVDKLEPTDFTVFGLPKGELLNRIQQQQYDFIIDLNTSMDLLIGYFAIKSGAVFRLHLSDDSNPYYNIAYHTDSPSQNNFASLQSYIEKIFVHQNLAEVTSP